MESTIRLFGLIIGIDQYKSGSIWNLESCVDDAKNVQRWLLKDLKVPKDRIATKDNVERSFSSHLIENTNIQRGDAILFYFAGHGSTVRSPERHVSSTEVLCTYDFGQEISRDISLHPANHASRTIKSKGRQHYYHPRLLFSLLPIFAIAEHSRWTPADKSLPRDAF
ncbi:hypothetical protein C8R46DRAFT_1157046, partial [Mycena filopes]